MTRDSVRRRGARPFGPGLLSDAATLVTVLIILAVLLRVLIGGFLLPLSGFRIDIGDFTAWAQRLADVGPGAFYETSYFSDYPPGYLYVLWLLGSVAAVLQPLTAGFDITGGLVKIPGVLADAGVGWMLFAYSRRFLDGRFGSWSGERIGVIAAAVYLFNPATIFDSAVWGQVDSVGTLVLLATLYWLARGWTEAAALGAVVALLVKFQFAFVIPIVAIVGIKRHLLGRSTDPEHDGRPEPIRVVSSLAAGLGSVVLLIWPFGMSLWAPGDPNHSLIGKFTEAANTYKGLTINAMNLWRTPWSGLGDAIFWGCDAPNPPTCDGGAGIAFTLGSAPLTWQLVGAILFATAAVLAFWRVARRDDPVGILEAALLLAVAFFAVPTRVHERYLFPALALAAPLVLQRWRSFRGVPAIASAVAAVVYVLIAYGVPLVGNESGDANAAANAAPFLLAILALAVAIPMALSLWGGAALYGLLSVSVFANVYWVYTADWSFVTGPPINPGVGGIPMVRDPFLAATLFSDWGVYAVSAMIVVVLGCLAVRAVQHALAPAPSLVPARAAAIGWQPGQGSGPEPAADAWPAGSPLEPLAPADEPGAFQRLRAWLQPDRLDPYLREPRRRLDRLDLLLVIGLVLFAFVFRLWRLDTPRSMHFDEVYHARSATEWLTDWQEGWTRDTYEWTHPMLAKYLIAAGIVVADPNKVTGATPLDGPATAIAVAPQRTAFQRPASIVFTAAGDETITAREVESGAVVASWAAPGPVASLAYDEDAERLLVGRADSGDVEVYLLSIFLHESGERSPPPIGAPLPTGLAAVNQVELPPDASRILLRGPDGIVALELATGLQLASSDLQAGGIGYMPSSGSDEDLAPASVVATDPARGVVAVLDAATLEPVRDGENDRLLQLPAAPVGPLQVRGGGDPQLYVPVGALPADNEHPGVRGGITVFDKQLNLIDTAPLPGAPRIIGWQSVANIIYVAGHDASSDAPAVWTVQPIGNGGTQSVGFAAFDTTLLPGQPLALGFDISDHDQDDDHGRLVVSVASDGGSGQLVNIDAGSNAFAWRLSGIVFGSILVALVYLLAATMFSRRRIAVLAASFIAVDAMSYVMSRISMNDIFVATFIAAAYLLFWQVWSGRWARSAWWVLPLVGILIGLAAATKWVGIYALLGLWVLVLARSGLGRFLLVALVAFITVVLGVGAPWPFLVICLVALAVALLVVWVRPIRLTPRDVYGLAPTAVVLSAVGLAFSLAYGLVPDAREARSGVELVFGILARAGQVAWPAWIMLGMAGGLILLRGLVSLRWPESDRRWMSPGEMGGFAWPWVGACLAVVPLLIYFLAYVPYLQLGHNIAGPDAGPGYGWSLDELHSQMFGYHFGLQAGHVASSPWWSWPLDLKPVFFYTHDFDDRTTGVIYNGGNPILFWAGIPALAWCAVQAWRRRSPALVLLVVAFAFQFLPWTRIERATFHYHYLSALPFAMVAVAYVVDEMLRAWSWRPLGIAFLVLAGIAGVLVFPLGSALAMPDWYINLARALPPWNYSFVFPSPPQGERVALINADYAKAAVGSLLALAAATFALFGRELVGALTAQRAHDQQQSQQHQADRPQPVEVDLGDVLANEEIGADPHQDQAEDHRPAP